MNQSITHQTVRATRYEIDICLLLRLSWAAWAHGSPAGPQSVLVPDLNRILLQWINGWPQEWAPFWRFLSEGIKGAPLRIAFAALAVFLLCASRITRKTTLLALASFLLANLTCDALKYGFEAPRPDPAVDMILVHGDRLTSFGTASAHSANMAAIAFVFTLYLGRWGWPWIVVALLTGLSRVYVGAHYPYQVALGWLVGVFCAFLVTRTWDTFVAWRSVRRHEP